MRYITLLIALNAWLAVHAQDTINTGLNGDLEIRDYSVGYQGIDDYCENVMDHAFNWHSTVNSPDYIDPVSTCRISTSFVHQGHGAGYVVAARTASEFAHTQAGIMQAGHTYQISFWIRRDSYSQPLSQVGVTISSSPPVVTADPYTTSVAPILIFTPTGNQYVQYKACYTAEVSGMHYFGIGPHGGLVPDTHHPDDYSGFIFDDIVVVELDENANFPTAVIATAQSNYCVTDEVLLDASGSTNVTSYLWDIVSPDDTSFHYQQGIQQGSPGGLNFSNIVPNPQRGVCYIATLQVYGICTTSEQIEFCFEDPTVPFVSYSDVCSADSLDMVVDGDDGWNYTWVQGGDTLSSGMGNEQITVLPQPGSSYYTVYFTTPEHCTGQQTILVNASDPNNLAPTMDGINHWGDYTFYVQQGGIVSFSSTLSNDHGNEVIIYSETKPAGLDANLPGITGGTLTVNWQISPFMPTGEYHYILSANDQNNCNPMTSVFDFRIIVVCDQCAICVDYESRTPSGTPLPPETKVGQCIRAGLSEDVAVGTASVLFQAGDFIELGEFFETGPGFEALIDTTTCIGNCEDCCVDWVGFTIDPIPDTLIIDFNNDDPTDDFLQFTDINHPFCAFNAFGWDLEIIDEQNHRWNEGVTGQLFTTCCELKSPAPENPIPHSSIYWDGHYTNIWGNYVEAPSYGFIVYLTLYGCNGQEYQYQSVVQIYSMTTAFGMVTDPSGNQAENLALRDSSQLISHQQRQEALDSALTITPNPTINVVKISGVDLGAAYYQIFDERAAMLTRKEKLVTMTVDLSDYSAGTYYLRIYSGSAYVTRKVVKI